MAANDVSQYSAAAEDVAWVMANLAANAMPVHERTPDINAVVRIAKEVVNLQAERDKRIPKPSLKAQGEAGAIPLTSSKKRRLASDDASQSKRSRRG